MNKTALITGASRGIGASIAVMLSQNGYNVVINYNKSEKQALQLAESITKSGGEATAIRADVSNKTEVAAMIETALKSYGKIDLLVNNAGIAEQKLFTDIAESDWDNMQNINLKSMFLCSQAVVPSMINNKSGNIVNISSVWGITGASCEVHYSATKAGVIGFTKALAKELAPSGIRVNCVAAGVIDTDMNSGFDIETMKELEVQTPLGRIGTVEDIANSVCFLASDKADFITGQVLTVDGGFAD